MEEINCDDPRIYNILDYMSRDEILAMDRIYPEGYGYEDIPTYIRQRAEEEMAEEEGEYDVYDSHRDNNPYEYVTAAVETMGNIIINNY